MAPHSSLARADDIVLLVLSASAQRTMLAICDNDANDYTVMCNVGKYWFYLAVVDFYMHPGHTITSQPTDNANTLKRRNEIVGQVNTVLGCFKKLNKNHQVQTVQGLYCTNMYGVYGCELWLFINAQINDSCASWRKSLHRVWGFPDIIHCYLLPMQSQCLHVIS